MSKARELSKLLSGTLKVGALQAPAGTTAQRPNGQVGQIRYNSTIGKNEMMDSEGWTAVASPPQITSVSPSTYNGEQGSSFTINGAFFDTGATVKFITNVGTEYSAATVSRISATQLIATTPQDFTVAQEPLKVKVINSSGLAYILDAAIDCGGVPAWNTASGLINSTEEGSLVNTVISAADPDTGSTITYSIQSGILPSGVSLNASNGSITGTAGAVTGDTTYNFTAAATDNAGNQTTRAFSIQIREFLLDGSSSARANTSALAIKNLTGTTTNGYYWININGTPRQVYVDMTDTNPWLLAMRFGNGTSTFGWSSGYWTDLNGLNSTANPLDGTEIKNEWVHGYIGISGMRISASQSANGWNQNVLNFPDGGSFSSNTLRSIFLAGDNTWNSEINKGRSVWMPWFSGAVGSGSSVFDNQPNCNEDRINGNFTYAKVRVGISMNNEADCATNDSVIGLGCWTNNVTELSSGGISWNPSTRYGCHAWLWVRP